MNRRLKRGTPFAAYAALIFNAALCVAPFIGARAVSIAYGDDRPQYEASPAALAATLQAMDARFTHLATAGDGSPREVWAQYVREELEAVLEAHTQALEAMKTVTEGLVRAIADEVAATRRAPAAYGRSGALQGARPDAASGIALNAKA